MRVFPSCFILWTSRPSQFFYNGKFDVTFLERELGYVPKYYEDVLVLVNLDDPDSHDKNLKAVTKRVLSIEMDLFESLFTDKEIASKSLDIRYKSPARCIFYACSDSDMTLRLNRHFNYIRTEFKNPSVVDQLLVDVIRRFEMRSVFELDQAYVKKSISLLERRIELMKEMVHRRVGRDFNLDSPKQVGIALFDILKLPAPGKTKTGAYLTNEKELASLAEKYPVVEHILIYKKLKKARSSYFDKLEELIARKVSPRFSLSSYSAPTYRLAAPGGDYEVDGKCGINFQAVSNGETRSLMGG